MKIFKMRIALTVGFMLFAICAVAQIRVTGIVKDATGFELPGVNVIVKGTTNGTITDIDGHFSITVNDEKAIIEFSFMGMIPQSVTVGNKRELKITLQDDTKQLDEVIIVGYGQVKKSDLTGAISSYRPNETEASKVISIDNMLQGKIAGLSIGTSTDTPGSASSVIIRGSNSLRGDNQPLYVIDNIPQASAGEFSSVSDGNIAIATNPLSSLNPADIESIEVLKDASATAIYGSRGANGVILVTTKKGKAGAAKVNVSANFTLTDAAKLLDMMSLSEHAQYRMIKGGGYPNEQIWKQDPQTGEQVWNTYYNFFLSGNDVYRYNGDNTKLSEPWSKLKEIDWQREIYSLSFSQNYNITVNGGSEKITYYVSGGYKGLEGLVKGTGLKQGDLRVNLNANLHKKVKLGVSVNGSIKENDMMAGGNSVGGATGAVSGAALWSAPYVKSQEELDQITNVYDRATVWTWVDEFDDKTKENTFRASIDFKWDIFKYLTYNLRAGGNINNQSRSRWYGLQLYEGSLQQGYVTQASFERSNYSLENLLQYNQSFKNIVDINATAAVTYDAYQSLSKVVVGNNFNVFDLRSNGLHLAGNKEFKQPDQNDYQLLSALARLNLTFLNGRYLMTASIRADGSSKFAKANRWAYFPAATIAWRLEQEEFMKGIRNIDQIKVRAGYGMTGSQSINAYSTLAPYGTAGDDNKPGQSADANGNILVGLLVNKLPNEGLKWETTSSYNIGLDFAFFKSRLSGTIDVYSKLTDNLLIQRDLPPSTGYRSMTINQGKMSNQGIELSLTGRLIDKKNFEWELSGNISFNNPTIQDFGLPSEIWGVNNDGTPREWKAYLGASIGNHFQEGNIFVAGMAPGLFYGYQTDGVIQANDPYLNEVTSSIGKLAAGNYKFVDRNKDGVINENDKTIIGNPNPLFNYGFQTNLRWKDLTLSMSFNGVYGNQILNVNARYYKIPSSSTDMVLSSSFQDMYRNENPWTPAYYSNTTPAADSDNPRVVYDKYVEDGSYLRCTDITLGYSFPKRWMQAIKFSNINIFASVKNAFIITKYSGYDPEVNTFAFDGTRPGIDLSSYPKTRSYIIGLNFSF